MYVTRFTLTPHVYKQTAWLMLCFMSTLYNPETFFHIFFTFYSTLYVVNFLLYSSLFYLCTGAIKQLPLDLSSFNSLYAAIAHRAHTHTHRVNGDNSKRSCSAALNTSKAKTQEELKISPFTATSK